MRRKKIWYVPGLISILGLPVLLLIWGPDDPVHHNATRIFIPSDRQDSSKTMSFNREGVARLLEKKKIITIDLDDLPSGTRSEFNIYQRSGLVLSELARLQFTHDTSEVLDVHLDEESTYGQFVWLINNAIVFHFKRFVYLDDDIYFFPNPPPVRYKLNELTINIPTEPIILKITGHKPTRWEVFCRWIFWEKLEAETILKFNRVLITGFLALILLPAILAIGKRSKTNRLRPEVPG
jgi:hypothetical protein